MWWLAIVVVVVLIVLILALAARQVEQYERGVVFRFGRVLPVVRDPGLH